jgi:hypothetical protein
LVILITSRLFYEYNHNNMANYVNFLRDTAINSRSRGTVLDLGEGAVSGYSLNASDTTSAGGVVDQVGSNDGTATGYTVYNGSDTNVVYDEPGPFGEPGLFARHNANGGGVEMSTLPLTADQTLMCWVKTTDTNGYIVSTFNGSVGYLSAQISSTDTTTIYNGSSSTSRSTPNLADGSWHHFAVTLSSTTMIKTFVDGVETTSANRAQANWSDPGSTYLFNREPAPTSANTNLLGSLAYFRAWSRALSGAEIVAEMNSQIPVSGDKLVAAMSLNGNSNDTNYLVAGPNSSFPVAWNFNGTDTLVSKIGATVPTSYPFTMGGWINFVPSSSAQTIVSLCPEASTTVSFGVRTTTTNLPALQARNTTIFTTSGATPLAAGPHRLVGVFESETVRKLYVDGVLVATSSPDSVDYPSSVDTIAVGSIRHTSPTNISGSPLAGVFVSDRAWSAEEVAFDYANNGFIGTEFGTIDTAQNRIDLADGEQIVWRMAYNSRDNYTRVQPAIDADADRTNMVFTGGSANTIISVSGDEGETWTTTPNQATTSITGTDSVLLKIQASGTATYWQTDDARGHDKPLLIKLR